MQHPLDDTWTGLIDDRYALRRMIGRGGMGEVWLADDLVLRRAVAVKLLHTQLALDEVAQSRIQREVRAAASLNHPRVAAVYDASRLPTGPPRPFLVMEYVCGHTAAERLRSAPPSPQEAVDWVAGTLEALSCAHAAGLVHRDVKPANVMITADGLVKVMDFGIAHISDGHDKGVTRTGSTVGTAACMSREQTQGRPVDARSDLYSTGCMLYELLRGGGDNAAQHSQEVRGPQRMALAALALLGAGALAAAVITAAPDATRAIGPGTQASPSSSPSPTPGPEPSAGRPESTTRPTTAPSPTSPRASTEPTTPTVAVPGNLVGKTLAQARADLAELGLNIALTPRSSDVGTSTVMATVPSSGTRLGRGDTVLLATRTDRHARDAFLMSDQVP
ncbi:serine/threonine-protein kinase [Streptomyces globisporus]|uniref:non-specific serine/threonine protein kinase n=1 Tax=Streptomyces globisporus TaxID=1908 RepID=A0A927BPN4_STRGL|nr:serine/threonine-protein kinase [Streptomyces globisporus]